MTAPIPRASKPSRSIFSLETSATIARAVARVDIVDNDNGVNVYSYGIGDDTYTLVSLTDVIVENANGGIDTVVTGLSYTLPANMENLVLTGTTARDGTGNAADNKLTGNAGPNKLKGLEGKDTLIGGDGADTLTGGNGSDSITPGLGADVIAFNSLAGADTVNAFNSIDDTFRVGQAGIHIGNGDQVVDGATTRAAPGGFATTAEVVVFTYDIVGTITTASAAATIGSATSAYATGDDRLFVVDNGVSTGIFRFHSSSANALVSAAELHLIATVKYDGGTTATGLADYTFGP